MEKKLIELKARLQEVIDLRSASAVLGWDQATYMPPKGAMARGRQLATLAKVAHEKFTKPEVGHLLDDLEPWAETLPEDSFEASLIRVTRRDYERATKIPASFQAELNEHATASFAVWTKARPDNAFSEVKPYLDKTLDLSRRLADYFPGYEHIADPLIDESDYGMKASSVREVFVELREGLVPLVKAVTDQPVADDACLRRNYPETEQLAFGEEIAAAFGFDFERGRQDKTHHPFMTQFSIDDCRITTRVRENDLAYGLFSTLHETGHALYELGGDPALEGTPLAGGTSSGVHESQSRLWENIVGRGREMWETWYVRAQKRFPGQLGDVPPETFYRAINKVERSLIRTEADELTYNLHVIIRFELELDLLEGTLSIADLPEAWRARYAESIGITPPDDRDGVMQDVHWYAGLIGGAFQGYTLGNILSAQFYEAAVASVPSIPEDLRVGNFDTLHGWLRENIYRHGRKFTAPELVERATGSPIRIEPYLAYLEKKFGEMYTL